MAHRRKRNSEEGQVDLRGQESKYARPQHHQLQLQHSTPRSNSGTRAVRVAAAGHCIAIGDVIVCLELAIELELASALDQSYV